MHPRLFCIINLLEGGGQSFSDRFFGLCSATPEAGFERCEGWRRYEDVERIQVGCFDLSDTLDRLCFSSSAFAGELRNFGG